MKQPSLHASLIGDDTFSPAGPVEVLGCPNCGEKFPNHMRGFVYPSVPTTMETKPTDHKSFPVTAMTQAEFDALQDYSCSNPTGVVVGKRWKRRVDFNDASKGWLLCTYVDEFGAIERSTIQIIAEKSTAPLAEPWHKPPLGIMPKKIWRRHRCIELTEAIRRYLDHHPLRGIVLEWASELEELMREEIDPPF